MKSRCSSLIVVAALCLSGTIEHASAQSAQSSEAPQSGAVLTRLSDPTYPPLARQARIAGDVDLMLTIRRDGSVESAVVVSGHPMLRQAALDSTRRSQFECRGCSEAANPYALKYKFQLASRDPPKDCTAQMDDGPPAVEKDLAGHQVTVSGWEMWTCDPASEIVGPARQIVKVRSAKCFYLWRCGPRDEN
jgi:TonB family protein